MINQTKLDKELKSVNSTITGISSATSLTVSIERQADFVNSYFTEECRIDFDHNPTQEEKTQADQIIAAHDPNPSYAELRKEEYKNEFDGEKDPYGEQLDYIQQALRLLVDDNNLQGNAALTEYLGRIDKVKSKYPKP